MRTRFPIIPAVALATAFVLASGGVGAGAAETAEPASPEGEEPAVATETIVTPTRSAESDDPPTLDPEAKKKEVIRSEALPHLVIHRKEKKVVVDGIICLRDGFLELFACGNGIREHESIVSLKARPRDVNMALILLGLTPGYPATYTEEGSFLPPYGPVFRAFVTYEQDGETKRVEAHKMMTNADTGEPPKPQKWVFCGGVTRKGQFLPDYEGTVVCVANFPAPVLDLPYESSTDNAERIFKARPEAIPAVGTEVKLVLQATGETIKGKKLVWALVVHEDGTLTLEEERVTLEELEDRLKNRNQYLRRVQILVAPNAPAGKMLDAGNAVTKHGLEVEFHKQITLEPEKEPSEAPDQPAAEPAE